MERADGTGLSPSALSPLKRAIDFAGSLAGICVLLPFLLLVGIMIKLQDGGPILYRRRVVGTGGEFDAFKFRSMRMDADAVLASDAELRRRFQQNFKLTDDPRVTPLGAILRRYSIDEIPQLINVLRGEMSLVGPRMITAPELAKYGEWQGLLRSVKPGLTGYWQVNGRQKIDYEERVRMDVHYITHWSLSMDLAILAKTPLQVLRGEGAY